MSEITDEKNQPAPKQRTGKARLRANVRARQREKKRRARVLARDGNQCQHPGCDVQDVSALTVHHIVATSDGGSNEMENLVCLCKYHHQQVHGILPLRLQ